MIADRIENTRLYTGVSARIAKGLEILNDASLASREDGRYEIDGEEIFYLIQRYTTKDKADARFEAHRNYIDIQVILAGEETIGFSPTEELEVTVPYKPDVMFLKPPTAFSELYLPAGTFGIFFPSDAHMPCYHATGPAEVTKAVIKIRV